MEETLKTLLEHRSIRKYKDTPIPKDKLDHILKAAIRTSTTGNMQVYSIIVTQDIEKRKALHKIHFGQDMVLEAPVLLTFNADFNRFKSVLTDSVTPVDQPKMLGTADAVKCTENY